MPINEPTQSFIPKKTLAQAGKKKRRSFGLFFGLSIIIFLLTATAAAGVYSYRAFLGKRVANMAESLERAKQAFEPSLIIELKRLNARINTATGVLAQHGAPSRFLALLEGETLKSVQFTRFEYEIAGDTVTVRLKGIARGYSSVALQSDVFGENKYIKNPIFSNLGLDQNGNVTFDVILEVDPSLVRYSESI